MPAGRPKGSSPKPRYLGDYLVIAHWFGHSPTDHVLGTFDEEEDALDFARHKRQEFQRILLGKRAYKVRVLIYNRVSELPKVNERHLRQAHLTPNRSPSER